MVQGVDGLNGTYLIGRAKKSFAKFEAHLGSAICTYHGRGLFRDGTAAFRLAVNDISGSNAWRKAAGVATEP